MRHLIRILILPVTIAVAVAGLTVFVPSTAVAWPSRSRGDSGHRKHHRHHRAHHESRHERGRTAHARTEREGPKGEL
jgi:hypothetical protein